MLYNETVLKISLADDALSGSMKKRFLYIFILICNVFFACVPKTASVAVRAETPKAGTYACILEETFFYEEKRESSGLFLFPKTYYVKLLEYGEEYSKIEYGDGINTPILTGYAKTALLTFVPYLPVRPYFSFAFEVKYTIGNDTATDSSFLTQITANCIYYGEYKIGSKNYCYVLRGEDFGYVPTPSSLYVEENGEYAEYLATKSEEKSTSAEEQKTSPSQIALLIALCLLVPLLAALILKPPRRPPYETDEY